MVLAASATGWFFVERISTTAQKSTEQFTDVVGPVSSHTMALIVAAESAHIATLEASQAKDAVALQNYGTAYDAAEKLMILNIRALEALSTASDMTIDTSALSKTQIGFSQVARQVLQLQADRLGKRAEAKAKIVAFNTKRAGLDKTVAGFARRAEQNMSAREDGGRTMIQSGDATMEKVSEIFEEIFGQSYPVLRGSYAVLGYLTRLQEQAQAAAAATDMARLDELQMSMAKNFKRVGKQLKRLRPRIRGEEDKAALKSIRKDFADLNTLTLGEQSLLATNRAALRAQQATDAAIILLTGRTEQLKTQLEGVTTSVVNLGQKIGRESTTTARQTESAAVLGVGVTAGFALLLTILLAQYIVRSISKSINGMSLSMREMASGNLDAELPPEDGSELSQMIEALEVFRKNGIERLEMEAQRNSEQKERDKRARAVEELIGNFDNQVNQALGVVSSATTEMESTAKSMSEMADMTSTQSSAVATASLQASTNVQTVAAAAEQLAASVQEITRQVQTSCNIAQEAVKEAEQATAEI